MWPTLPSNGCLDRKNGTAILSLLSVSSTADAEDKDVSYPLSGEGFPILSFSQDVSFVTHGCTTMITGFDTDATNYG